MVSDLWIAGTRTWCLVANLIDNALCYNTPGGWVELQPEHDTCRPPAAWDRRSWADPDQRPALAR